MEIRLTMRTILFYIFLFGTINLSAQRLSGVFSNGYKAGEKIYLFEREGKRQSVLDSAIISANGSFIFKQSTYPLGLYNLQYRSKNNQLEIILNSQEPRVHFVFPHFSLKKHEVIYSQENKVYQVYKKRKKERDKELKKLNSKLQAVGMDPYSAAEVKKKMNFLRKNFFEFISENINENPNTFFTKLILARDADNKEVRHMYFSDIDFNDESFIRTNVLADRYREYILLFSGRKINGYMNCIDEILDKAKTNQKVYEFSTYNLLEGFHNTGIAEVSNYILDEYIFGDDCGGWEVSDVLKSRGGVVRSIQLNNIPPDLVMRTNKGVYSKLSTVTSDNKYTLLLFWASWCHKCEAQMDDLVSIYSKYKSSGFEVYAVSLDEHKSSWMKEIEMKGMNWQNVCDFKSWQSTNVQNYKVSRTPTFFLLDSDRKIVAKPKHISELSKVLAELKKMGAF